MLCCVVLCCVVLCCVVLCCVVLCCVVFKDGTGEKAVVKRDSALLERFFVSETMFTPCYLLVRCRTNLDGCFIFVHFVRIVKVFEGRFSFFIAYSV